MTYSVYNQRKHKGLLGTRDHMAHFEYTQTKALENNVLLLQTWVKV